VGFQPGGLACAFAEEVESRCPGTQEGWDDDLVPKKGFDSVGEKERGGGAIPEVHHLEGTRGQKFLL